MTAADVPHAARDLPESVQSLLRGQHWLATTAQLKAAGVTRSQIRWGLARRWTSPLPRVIRIGDGDLPPVGRARAAHLYAGAASQLTGPSAAVAYGIEATRTRDEVVHLLVPVQCSGRRERWVHLHRTAVADDGARVRDGVLTVSPPRAVIDAARWCPTDDAAQAVVIEACQKGVTTPQQVRDRLEMLGRAPGTARVRRALVAAETGAWSVPEYDLMRLVEGSDVLPEPWLNPALTGEDGRRLVSPDMWFEDVGLAVMVHSKAHHQIGEDWTNTVESDAELVALGVHTIGITPTRIRTEPGEARSLVERAYTAAREQGRTTRVLARRRA